MNRRGVAVRSEDAPLRAVQLWFARAMMTPEGEPAVVDDREAERRLTPGPRLSALERLEIYRRAYHARLIECLADDYPVLKHALGDDAFRELCSGLIARHPSVEPSLNFFGRHMPTYCREEAALTFPERAFAADLAALEWAIVEVIHAPTAEPLTLEGLRDMPTDVWARSRLVPSTALRLLHLRHPVNAYFQAFRDGNAPAIPGAAPSAAAVYRRGPTVWRMNLTFPMFEVLSALSAGEPLGVSLARAEGGLEGVEPADAAQQVAHWFREWVASGLFTRIELGS